MGGKYLFQNFTIGGNVQSSIIIVCAAISGFTISIYDSLMIHAYPSYGGLGYCCPGKDPSCPHIFRRQSLVSLFQTEGLVE